MNDQFGATTPDTENQATLATQGFLSSVSYRGSHDYQQHKEVCLSCPIPERYKKPKTVLLFVDVGFRITSSSGQHGALHSGKSFYAQLCTHLSSSGRGQEASSV